MTHSSHRSFELGRLFWVGVIAAVASLLTGWFRWESIPMALALSVASAAISIAIVWFVDWTRRPG